MYTKNLSFLFLIIFLSCGSSCEKNNNITCSDEIGCEEDYCINDIEIIDFNPDCFNNIKDSYIINNDSTYQLLKFTILSTCDTSALPSIDFSKRTLLGKYAYGGGCDICFQRKVFKDFNNKVYTYNIKIVEIGGCDKLRYSMNWITIPRITEEYNVIFKIDK